ncbi:PaaI family thioesterase [Spirillospora sp. NPDC047279]|uniref:PaaI family thioesterase n=1 Tax=Spirillospora sp. NPDC047279 TaxID=3155478 RepID=UPI0033C23FEE
MTTPAAARPGPASSRTTPPPGAAVPEPSADAVDLRIEDPMLAEYDGCFGCGDQASDGIRLKRTGYDGSAVDSEFLVAEAHQGAPGLAHGGVLAAALDEALGTSAWTLGRRYVTGRLETDYLAPVPVGSTVHLRTWCTGVEGRKAYFEGEGRIGGPDGPLAVRAAALFIEVPPEHFTRNGGQV